MIPNKFNMVDMGGIDLIMMQGETVPGLYDRLVDSISTCQYQCLYNWMFDGILIPPTYTQMTIDTETGNVLINEGVEVTNEDVIEIYSIQPPAPPPIEPVISPITIIENGVYNVPQGLDGYNPITVDVPTGGSMDKTCIFESENIVTSGTLDETYLNFDYLLFIYRQTSDHMVYSSLLYPTSDIISTAEIGTAIAGTNYCYIKFNSETTFINGVSSLMGIIKIYGVSRKD